MNQHQLFFFYIASACELRSKRIQKITLVKILQLKL